MMMQLIFVDPIIGDPSTLTQELEQMQPMLYKDLGVDSWQVWIQKGPGSHHYGIQRIVCREPESFASRFQEAAKKQQVYARLNELFFKAFSCEGYLTKPTATIDEVLYLDIDPSNPSKGFEFCYMLPLLPGNIKAHEEYCRAAMEEKREHTIAACKAFGMIDMRKWIQQSPKGDFVLYYQRMAMPVQEARASFLTLKDEPKALQATLTLRNQTGVTFEELFPESNCITFK